MKKLFTFFVALICASSAFAYDCKVDGIYYNLNTQEKTAEVTNETGDFLAKSYSGSVVIPEKVTYNSTTYSVTTIGDEAFEYCSGLTSVTIGNSVTKIGNEAFKDCRGLTSVTIPHSVTTIGNEAFVGCSKLTSIYVDASNTHYCSVDGVLFNYPKDTLIQYPIGNTRTEYTIPNSVTTIGNSAFTNSKYLISITIPNSVTTIGESAFSGCSGLTSITIPNSVTTIGECAFYDCSGLTSIEVNAANTHYCSMDGVLFNFAKDTLIQYPLGNTRTEYTIPNSVTTIGSSAFSICTGLTSVTIPNSVTTIGEYAFEYCFGLTSITIPNSVTTIGKCAFRGCSGLTSIEIPNSVTTIGEGAFYWCTSLTSIEIPNSVTTIGNRAFADCSSLTSVTFLGNACQNAINEDAFLNVGKVAPALLTLHGTWAKENLPDEDGNWYGGKFELSDTALPTVKNAVKATKVMTNSQVILRQGKKNYTILGQEK